MNILPPPLLLNSCLYRCTVMHQRLHPKTHTFSYRLFLFYLDLDEIALIGSRFRFISHNWFNLFNFRDKDHMKTSSGEAQTLKEKVLKYVAANGTDPDSIGKIMLLTNTCTFGYIFNPVSFYFLFDKQGNPLLNITQVSNTFHEMKLYFIDNQFFSNGIFKHRRTKYFYVSPFIDHDTDFDFDLAVPTEILDIKIDDYQNGTKIFKSSLYGSRIPLSDSHLLYYFFAIPLITFKIIAAIYWQALKLLLKKFSYHKKTEFPELQKDVLNPHRSLIHVDNFK